MHLTRSSSSRQVAAGLRVAANQICQRFTSKIAVELEAKVEQQICADELKPRFHPGINKQRHFQLPTQLAQTLKRVVGDYPVKALVRDCKLLNQYINSRHPPPDSAEVENKMQRIFDELDQKMPAERLATLSEEDTVRWQRKRELYINKRIAQRTYAWKPITYGAYEALVYAIGRGAHEYAVLQRILREIRQRDTNFRPRSYFDFGSGVGTGMWVAKELWSDSIYEYYNVDSSRHMNELSELILREGHENQQMLLKNVYYRQFLPGLETKYDLVIASHVLFELPSAHSRKEVLLNLWRKCDGYLVLVEEGTRRGAELVNEARRYLLGKTDPDVIGHTFAPCAHDKRCPRLADIADRTPCNFELSYTPLRIGDVHADSLTARYSYAVLKKGDITDVSRNWPRIVRPTLLRSKHAICRMCTADGKLQEVIFTKSKHGKAAYTCAKATRWGDRLPMSIGEPYAKTNAPSAEQKYTKKEFQEELEELEQQKPTITPHLA